ncbi:MAG: alpha/beta hydrolase [Chloroflexota bacterium]
MNESSNGYLETNDGKLYYETAGTGVPIVMLHAGFLDRRMFDAQWAILAQNYRPIRYDMLGFGKSGAATRPVCRRENLLLLLDHCGVEAAHIVACSMGGTVALDFALEHSSRVRSLTLVDATPSGFEMQGAPPSLMMEMFGALQQGDVDAASELQIRIWLDTPTRVPADIDSELRRRALGMNRIAVERQTALVADAQPVCPLEPAAVSRLSEVTCPALIVTGVLDHAEVQRAATMMAETMPGAHHVTIEAAGHVPSFERPDVFNVQLTKFLSALAG